MSPRHCAQETTLPIERAQAEMGKYTRMKAVIWKGYYKLPVAEHHPAIDSFQRLAARMDTANPSDPDELDSAYEAALPHVQGLIERGLLKGDLDADTATTDELGATNAAPPAVREALGDQSPGETNTTANDNTTVQAAPMPELPAAVDQRQEPVSATAPAVLEALGDAPAPATETTNAATDEPKAPEPPVATEPKTITPAAHIEIPFHAVASIFPMMSETDLQELAQDIKEHGLHEPIWICNGKIIDGRNRYRACLIAGVEPRFQTWDGEGSLAKFVLSLNLHRRHLTRQQRAMAAARAKKEFEAEALERSRSNLLQNKGATEGLDPAPRSEGKSAERAAAMLQVSTDATKKADRVLKDGAPELVTAVEQETVSLDAAALVATLPVDEQRDVVEQGRVKEKAKELRQSKKAAKAKAEGDEPGQAEGEQQPDHTSATSSDHSEVNDSSNTKAEPRAARDREGLHQPDGEPASTAEGSAEVPAQEDLGEAIVVNEDALRALAQKGYSDAKKYVYEAMRRALVIVSEYDGLPDEDWQTYALPILTYLLDSTTSDGATLQALKDVVGDVPTKDTIRKIMTRMVDRGIVTQSNGQQQLPYRVGKAQRDRAQALRQDLSGKPAGG